MCDSQKPAYSCVLDIVHVKEFNSNSTLITLYYHFPIYEPTIKIVIWIAYTCHSASVYCVILQVHCNCTVLVTSAHMHKHTVNNISGLKNP